MKSHASINRIYRLVWNAALGLWVAVAETAKGRSRGGSGRGGVAVISAGLREGAGLGFVLHKRCRAAVVMLLAMSVFNLQVHAADALNSTVVVGSGNVSTSGATTTINQTSQRLAIDWTQLSTAANEALVFNQPNAQAIALNRITGSSPSEFLGSLTANGQVFILNPNGVLFGAGSQVNVGGLVASTLSMSNADFMAGSTTFGTDPGHAGTGSSAGKVVNKGTLTAAPGGYVALLAPEVRNEGVITASLGTALLAAGNKITLNLDNGNLLGYSIDQGAINALAENKLLIQANGGQVLLSAKAMDQLTTATVNNTGIIEAKTIANKAGRILLMGDMETGTVNVGGTLDASAPDGGNGGFIETSAANVNVAAGTRVTTKATNGQSGTWLIDPVDFTIDAGGAAQTTSGMGADTLSAALDLGNVSIATDASTGGNGDINVNSAVSWSANPSTLTLTAHRDINFNANVTYSGTGAAGLTAQATRNIAVGTGVAVASTGTGSLAVVLGGPTVGSAAGGAISLASGSSVASNGGDITFKGNSIALSGADVTANGGSIAMTASGVNDTHSVEIANSGATQSNVTTTGAGNITISGNLTSGGTSATGGSAGGVVVTNSNITAGNGTITVTGDAGWPSGLAQVSRGVRLDSGAKITGAGNINITGRVGRSSSATSKGLHLAGGAEVSSTGGDISLTGTLNNPSILDGTGLHVSGKVQSGASKKITLTGSATVGGASGTGVLIDGAAQLLAGTGGLTIVGSVSSSTTATNVIGTHITTSGPTGPTISSTGAIDITGTMSASSASGNSALRMEAGTINSNGANIVLRGSGVPAPAPAAARDVRLEGTAVTSGGGEIQIIGNRVEIASAVNAGAGRVVIAPFNTNRQITLASSAGGIEAMALNLSDFELNRITAGVLQIGTLTSTGGIEIAGPITAAPGPLPVISLLNASTISQTGAISVGKLNAVGSSVILTNAGNQIDEISGRSTTGAFAVTSSKAAPLTVGTVDGYAGTNSGGNATTLTNMNGAIAQTQAIVASSFTGSSNGGTTLGLAGNQIGAFNLTNSGSGNIVVANGIATTLTSVTNTGGGRIDVDNTGGVTVASVSSDGAATGTTSGTAAISVKSSQGISASGGGTHIATGAGSLYLEGAGSVGASSGTPLRTSATRVSAQATGAGAQVNLVLTNGGTLENIAANSTASVSATAGSLAVKTVSGSAVTLAANAGAITDANGAANNVTATSLTASSQNGIALGTNVSGAQTLSTTGAAGDITITAANAIDTSNFSVSTNAGSAQTVSLTSNAGITVGSAFGNTQDKLKLIATGGNIAVNGALTASELTLSTAGTSTQSAAITATGLELLGSGSHTLNNAGNAVTTLAGNTGNVDYSQAGALTIGTVNTAGLTASGKVLVRATGAAGDITLNNAVTSGSAASDSLVLAAGRNFINNAGATPLNPGAGRFLVYSTDPTANTMGGITSTGNAFSRTYAANAPTDASMTSLSGNRMVYSVTPLLTITGNNQAKVYGAADPGLTYTLNSGLVAGDTAATALAGVLAAPTGSAASAGTHAITQGTLASALGYGIAYTNGTLTVDKATVSVTGMAANNKTYDGGVAATLSNTGALVGLVYGEALTLNSTGASFIDANVGTGKAVTATYNLANGVGGLASNYQLAAAPVTGTADINKANLTVTANNDNRTVGAAAYAGGNGVSYSGFVAGETAAVLGGALSYGGSSQGATAVGNYAITASGYTAANYALAYVDGVLSINPVATPVPVPVVPGGNPASDAYLSALRNIASLGASGGGAQGGGADPSDALKAAAAEAGNTNEE
ncbi:MBG domain-containing protein [Polaromonas aquatica]|uniref:two-partner secretion domain-containing protein n=1 Tax=Polaromonas aquatica TaxID=332657 RepID=UPI003D6518B9